MIAANVSINIPTNSRKILINNRIMILLLDTFAIKVASDVGICSIVRTRPNEVAQATRIKTVPDVNAVFANTLGKSLNFNSSTQIGRASCRERV